ncbi:MAG TPA: hypothetical protein DEG71_00240 [Clostridiales bacterium]|nr:hypothetical protein [Clostridiales bacterium]
MTTPNRWAIRDSGEASFFSLVDNHAIVTLPSLKTTGVETTGTTVYARGGRGNAKLVGFSSDRESKLKLQDAIFDNHAVAMLTGNDIVTGVHKVDVHEIITTTSDKASVINTPVGAIISVYVVNADGTNGTEYTLGTPATNPTEFSIVSKELTFPAATADGTKFRVYYFANTDATAKTVKVTSDMFGGSFRVVIDVLVVDEYTKAAYQGQLIIPNGKFEDNFNLAFAATGDPSMLDLNLECLKSPTSTTMWELVIYDDALLA